MKNGIVIVGTAVIIILVVVCGCTEKTDDTESSVDKSKFIGTWEFILDMHGISGIKTTIIRFTFYNNDTACYNMTNCYENNDTASNLCWYSFNIQDNKLCCYSLDIEQCLSLGCQSYKFSENNTRLALFESEEQEPYTWFEKIS